MSRITPVAPVAGAFAATLVVIAALSGCAKKAPPSGGPPDLTPPKLVGSEPDSGAAGVPVDAPISISFSEGMEPRSTGDAVALAPRIEIRKRRWKAMTLSLELAEPLKPDQTYTLFVGTGARDRHGNGLASGGSVTFSTADSFPPGLLEGEVDARGLAAPGIYLWCYKTPGEPDSTARDFDALALTDADGRFRLAGLRVPAAYRLWAFADLNNNRSFEPLNDVLVAVDTLLVLSASAPIAPGLRITVTNPRAPAAVQGAVLDSLADSLGVLYVTAVSEADTTKRLLGRVTEDMGFEFSLDAGVWLLQAFRDLDKDRKLDEDDEPASHVERLDLPPAGTVRDLTLTLRRPQGGP